jgi:hypothetical protein
MGMILSITEEGIGTGDEDHVALRDFLPSGFYLVLQEEATVEELLPVAENEVVAVYPRKYQKRPSNMADRYLVINQRAGLPLPPFSVSKNVEYDCGHTILVLKFEADATGLREEFLAESADNSVAVVAGGEIFHVFPGTSFSDEMTLPMFPRVVSEPLIQKLVSEPVCLGFKNDDE